MATVTSQRIAVVLGSLVNSGFSFSFWKVVALRGLLLDRTLLIKAANRLVAPARRSFTTVSNLKLNVSRGPTTLLVP